jgi:ABC-type nitrate/sulfonate/bicarbonate transport system permease component
MNVSGPPLSRAGRLPWAALTFGLSRSHPRLHAALLRTAAIAVLVGVWAALTHLGVLDPLYVSTPAQVVTAWLDLVENGEAWSALAQTGEAILIAFAVGTVCGFVFGLLVGLSPLIRKAYFPAVLFLLSTPKVVFVPLFILVLGINSRSVEAFGAFQAFFYVTVEVVGGVGMVQQTHLRLARAFRATWPQTLRHVVLPAASPGLFSAVWFGLKQALTGALIVELFVSAGGLGQLIERYTNSLKTGHVLALVLTVTIIAILVGVAINFAERRLCRWQTTDDLTGKSV